MDGIGGGSNSSFPGCLPNYLLDMSGPFLRVSSRALLFGVGYFAFAHLGLLFVADVSAIAGVWPAAGFALAWLLLAPRREWPLILFVLGAANTAANLLHGAAPSSALGFFWRITDNWLEMSVRFLVAARGVREVKDAINREILGQLDAADIGLASATYNIVGLPPLRLDRPPGAEGA